MRRIRQHNMSSYGTTWTIFHKIRRALRQRDENYKLKDTIELDGASFGKRKTKNQAKVLVAIETKDWVDEKGRAKSKAGLAKIEVVPESSVATQKFVNEAIEKDSLVNTDGASALKGVKNVDVDYQVVGAEKEVLDRWLPWVHKFVSNAKAWALGTHHFMDKKYWAQYLGEYTYRFNRRHDPNGFFHRALTACALARPVTIPVLLG